MEDSPYQEDLQPIQGELGNIVDKGPELKTLEELEEAGLVGISWNEWLECVQWYRLDTQPVTVHQPIGTI